MLAEAVEQHRDGAAPNDDLTLMYLKLQKNKNNNNKINNEKVFITDDNSNHGTKF